MRKHSNLEQNEVFFLAAAICAHSTYYERGFRQRDLKFMVDMFSNWMDVSLRERSLFLHNTQVLRFLQYLVSESWAKQVSKQKNPVYRLTPVGLLQLISRLVHRKPQFPLEHFYFVVHVIDTYRPQIEALLKSESAQFPSGLRMEIEALLEIHKPLQAHKEFIQFELKKLKSRIQDSKLVVKIVMEGREKKKLTKDIVREIEKKFPYDLNSQKPLSEFYSEMPTGVADWILDIGLKKRTIQLWLPLEQNLEAHLTNLEQLERSLQKKP